MPYTIPASFVKFLENITVGDQSATATGRRDSVVALLEKKLEVVEAFPTGSLVRRTALRGHADVDVIVALHYSKHIQGKTPGQVLQLVQSALSDYNAKIVKRNGQAVTLYFTTWPNVDVVPASQAASNGVVVHYNIPDSVKGTWLSTNPAGHDSRVSAMTLEGRQMVRMIKAWNHSHSEFMRSFHIETLVLKVAATGDWTWELYNYFKSAAESLSQPLFHPDSLNGRVDEYLGQNEREALRSRLIDARDRTNVAWTIDYRKEDPKEAIRQLGIVFGDYFPPYG